MGRFPPKVVRSWEHFVQIRAISCESAKRNERNDYGMLTGTL